MALYFATSMFNAALLTEYAGASGMDKAFVTSLKLLLARQVFGVRNWWEVPRSAIPVVMVMTFLILLFLRSGKKAEIVLDTPTTLTVKESRRFFLRISVLFSLISISFSQKQLVGRGNTNLQGPSCLPSHR